MIAFADVALLRPAFLLIPPLLAGLALWLALRGGLGDWRRAIDPALFRAMEARGGVIAGAAGRRFTPAVLAAMAVAAALSGPAVERATTDSFRNLDGLIVAVDLSRSVAEGGGLGEARISAMEAVEAAGGRQAGLIVYAGDAYLAATFTTDRAALGPLVASLRPDMLAEPGSAPDRAIRLAAERFAEAGVLAGDLVLVGDGGGFGAEAERAAASLRAGGHRVHVLFVPHGPGAPDGVPAADAEAASRLAAAGGGLAVPFTDLAPLASALAEPATTRLARSPYAALGWQDFGRALLVLAALPLLLLFRRAGR